MIVGVTGSSSEFTKAQAELLGELVSTATELHHGDCVGVDALADAVAACVGIRRVIHPPIDPKKRAFCQGELILPEKSYLVRNRDIVNAVEELIVVPSGPEQRRSGTWATYRYARQERVPRTIVWPDGKVVSEQ